jgi:hypothetical protein
MRGELGDSEASTAPNEASAAAEAQGAVEASKEALKPRFKDLIPTKSRDDNSRPLAEFGRYRRCSFTIMMMMMMMAVMMKNGSERTDISSIARSGKAAEHYFADAMSPTRAYFFKSYKHEQTARVSHISQRPRRAGAS